MLKRDIIWASCPWLKDIIVFYHMCTNDCKSIQTFFFSKTWWISMNRACMRQTWIILCMHEFFPHLSMVSIGGKQYLNEVVFSAIIRFPLYITSMHHRVKKSPKSTTGHPLSPMWCHVLQETGVVVNRQLAPPSRKCSSTFLALYSDFFGEKLDSCGLPGFLQLFFFLPEGWILL